MPALRKTIPFEFGDLDEAIRKMDRRTPIGSRLSSRQWMQVPLQLRETAQFSARVESVRFPDLPSG